MKIRIRDNSLRVRMDRREIEQLAGQGRVEAQCEFGLAALRYTVAGREQLVPLAAEFSDAEIRIYVNTFDAADLAGTERVGLETQQPIGDGRSLRLVLEKDFQCLADRPEEDDTHAYDNPLARHTCAAHDDAD